MPKEIHELPLSEALDLHSVHAVIDYIADWCRYEIERIEAGIEDKDPTDIQAWADKLTTCLS